MSCTISNNKKLYNIDSIDSLYGLLFENKEIAGSIPIDKKLKTTINKGSRTSVKSPEALVTYHTHPFHCYQQEKTVWGFPSGEDIRECIISALKGNIAHLILTIEGTYVCQVNRKVIDKILSIDDDLIRGLVILFIEIYFRSTHAFRCYDVIQKHSISVYDYIHFVNIFEFNNLFSKKEIKGCTSLKCNQVWVYEDKLKKKSFNNYILEYENDTEVFKCNKYGNTTFTGGKIDNDKYISMIKHIKSLDIFKEIKFFKLRLFENFIIYNDIKFTYVDLKDSDKYKFIMSTKDKHNTKIKSLKRPYFIYNGLNEKCTNKDIIKNIRTYNQFSESKKHNIIMIGSEQCHHCVTTKYKLENYSTVPIIFKIYKTNIKAIEMANKLMSRNDIDRIPVFIDDNNKKLISSSDLINKGIITYID